MRQSFKKVNLLIKKNTGLTTNSIDGYHQFSVALTIYPYLFLVNEYNASYMIWIRGWYITVFYVINKSILTITN